MTCLVFIWLFPLRSVAPKSPPPRYPPHCTACPGQGRPGWSGPGEVVFPGDDVNRGGDVRGLGIGGVYRELLRLQEPFALPQLVPGYLDLY